MSKFTLLAAAAAVCASAAPAFATTITDHIHTAECEHWFVKVEAPLLDPNMVDQNGVNIASISGGPGAQAVTSPTFIITDTGGVAPGSAARAAFEAALDFYRTFFSDNVTVRLDLGFRDLGNPNVLAQAGSSVVEVPVSTARAAMQADVTSLNDQRAVAAIPTTPTRYVSNEPGTCTATPGSCGPIDARSRTIDNDNTRDNNFVDVNTASAKALGLIADDPALIPRDAVITFNSAFAFDLDRSDGIDPTLFDFIAIAVHEIGHALGFRSGVDLVDNNALPLGGATLPATPGGPTRPRFGLDGISYATLWDFFRYQDGEIDWTVGGAPCFSLDRGRICGPDFATGAFNGDRRQASHWKDNRGIGLMDPTFARGETGNLSYNDLLAFDLLGWDLTRAAGVPAPAGVALFGLGVAALGLRRRRA